jgi:hypothetical protein
MMIISESFACDIEACFYGRRVKADLLNTISEVCSFLESHTRRCEYFADRR